MNVFEFEVNCSALETKLHTFKNGDSEKSLFLTHSLKYLINREVSVRGKVDQGCSASSKDVPFCPSILVDEPFDAYFQVIGMLCNGYH